MRLKVKIISKDGNESRIYLVEDSTTLNDFVKEHKVSGPFQKCNGSELQYAIAGNEETFAVMRSSLSIEKEKFEHSVYFKKLSSEELAERARKEASSKFKEERESKMDQLIKRIENVRKIRDEVGKFTALGDKFLSYFENVKVDNGMKSSDFEGVKSKKEALDAIKQLEGTLEKVASGQKLEVDFSLENKCLSLLKSSAPIGIEFKEIDQPYILYFSTSKNGNFYSKKHWKENNQSKLFKKNRLAVGGEGSGGGFGGWGAAAGAASYGYKSYYAEEINLGEEGASEATQVVVSKQSISQLVKFQAKSATLTSAAEDKARQVARESKTGNTEALRDFFKEYPEKINFGPFGVGGRFEIIAVTTANEKTSLSKLQTIASKRVNHDFKLALSFGTVTGAGLGSGGFQKDSVEAEGRGYASGSAKIELSTQTEKYCYGPDVTNEEDLNRILHIDPQSWNIFPAADVSEHSFVSIHKLIQDMAKQRGGDEELSDAAVIMKNFLKEQEQEEAKRKEEEAKRREDELKKQLEEAKRMNEEKFRRGKRSLSLLDIFFCSELNGRN